MQGDGFASEPGGIMEVAMWLCIVLLLGLWCSLGLVPNYVVLVPGKESGGPHHMQGCHTRGLWIGLRKLVVLTFEYSSNIQLRLNIFLSFLIPMFCPKANMNIFYLYKPHSYMYVQYFKVLVQSPSTLLETPKRPVQPIQPVHVYLDPSGARYQLHNIG
jgi:hypothetical protein